MSNRPRRTFSALSGPRHFEAAMSIKPCARSPHFMVHFLPRNASGAELSTGGVTDPVEPVDDSIGSPDGGLRLGLVVPKRHARRAVTRNAVKRQLRAAVFLRLADLPLGDWVVRLRAPIPRQEFTSARSEKLLSLLKAEIETVLGDAQRRARRAVVASGTAADPRSADAKTA